MQSHMENPALAARGVPNSDLLAGSICSEHNLATRRAQHLAEIFALPAQTALTIAELAFGEGSE